jgi:hypothetical protein
MKQLALVFAAAAGLGGLLYTVARADEAPPPITCT